MRAAVDFAEMLAENVDAAIAYGRGDWPGLIVDRLVEEKLVPLCSPAVCNGTSPLRTPADLASHTLIHTETKLVTWAMWLEAAGVESVNAHRGPRFNRADLALEAASADLGIALDNPIFAKSYLARGALVIPFDPIVSLQEVGGYYFVCRPKNLIAPKVELFRRWVVETATADNISN